MIENYQGQKPSSTEICLMSKSISSRQLKAALALLRWNVADLANASGVSEPTIWRLETADGPLGGKPETGAAVIGALEGAGIIFIAENGEGEGIRLRKFKHAKARG